MLPPSHWMNMALALAEKGLYSTSPNPRVGCVLVKNDRAIGQGYHEKAGEDHAEINALKGSNYQAQGSTAYINLEPCYHHNRTPPCVDALIKHGVKKVYMALKDPNPEVAGKSMKKLQGLDIEVEDGLMRDEAIKLNCGFIKRYTRGLPWVRVKVAQTFDGKMIREDSQWITGTLSRQDVHHWRARSCAVLSGASSIRQDNSRLNVRFAESSAKNALSLVQPLRIALDPLFSLTPELDFFTTPGPKLWVGAESAQSPLNIPCQTEVTRIPGGDEGLDLKFLLESLASRGVNELMVESGPRLTKSFLTSDLLDELILYIAPPVDGRGDRSIISLTGLTELKLVGEKMFGHDLRMVFHSPV